MSEAIKQTYREIEIAYIERDDKWNFTVNGRERNLESLTKAKESIDRALDREVKERPWKPFEAWHQKRFGDREYQKVRVTSEADKDYGRRHFWIMGEVDNRRGGKEQKRQKVAMDYLFQVSPENDAAIEEIVKLRLEAESLYSQASTLHSQLGPIQTTTTE